MATHNERIIVTHEEGVRFSAQIRSHRVIVDQTHRGGGTDTAPSPIELLGVSLGTCIAYYLQQFCHARKLSIDGLRVEVEQQGVKSPNRIARFVVHVVLPHDFPEAYAGVIDHVVKTCPAHNTLALGAEVDITVESGALVA
jgi:putative redox protein